MRRTVSAIDDWLDRRVPAARRDEPQPRDEANAAARRGGRMWLNGEEIGGPRRRFSHLDAAYD